MGGWRGKELFGNYFCGEAGREGEEVRFIPGDRRGQKGTRDCEWNETHFRLGMGLG